MANPRIYDQLLDEVMNDLDEKGAEVEAEEKKRKKKKAKNKSNKPAPETVPETAAEETADEDIFGLSNLNLGPQEEYPDYEIYDEKVLPEKENTIHFSRSSHKLGEPVSEEYVEELRKKHAAQKDGYRATVIFHTRTVLESGDLAGVPADIQDIPEEPEPAKPAERKVCSIMRLDTGEIYEIAGKVTIGRDDDNDIVIPEPEGHYVSGFHATIETDERGRMMLRDREGGSTNGTLVNGVKIGSRYIRQGDTITFANVDFVVPKN